MDNTIRRQGVGFVIVRINSNLAKTANSLAAKLKLLEPGGAIYENIMRAVSLTMLSEVKRRIHNEGKAADGGNIGHYSTKPIYVSRYALDANKLEPFVGKPSETLPNNAFVRAKSTNVKSKKTTSKKVGVKANGTTRRSTYVKGGYEEYKTRIGRNELGKVNLSLSGQMNAQFVVLEDGNRYFLGWPNDLYGDIAEGQETHFRKKIWKLTAEEEKKFAEEFEKQMILALQ